MTNAELINQSSLSEQNCTCGKLYVNRKLVSPDCVPCNYREEVSGMLDKAREDERAKPVWEFKYCCDKCESAAATVSIHRTKEGAEKAMAWHKEEARKDWQERITDEQHAKDYPFGWNEEWFIVEAKLEN